MLIHKILNFFAKLTPLYQISQWNCYETACLGETRTTNYCEGSHNYFNSILTSSNPTIWKLLGAIEKDIACQMKAVADEDIGNQIVKKEIMLN